MPQDTVWPLISVFHDQHLAVSIVASGKAVAKGQFEQAKDSTHSNLHLKSWSLTTWPTPRSTVISLKQDQRVHDTMFGDNGLQTEGTGHRIGAIPWIIRSSFLVSNLAALRCTLNPGEAEAVLDSDEQVRTLALKPCAPLLMVRPLTETQKQSFGPYSTPRTLPFHLPPFGLTTAPPAPYNPHWSLFPTDALLHQWRIQAHISRAEFIGFQHRRLKSCSRVVLLFSNMTGIAVSNSPRRCGDRVLYIHSHLRTEILNSLYCVWP